MVQSYEEVSRTIAAVLDSRHFALGTKVTLEHESQVREQLPWEIFRGRLLEPRFTRRTRSFVAWNAYLCRGGSRSDQPLISVKLDSEAGEIHITRSLYCYVWESGDAGTNVIDSRETTRWLMELMGTLRLADFQSADELGDELAARVFQAVVGTSRLPLNSVEAPLPDFTLGNLGYFFSGPRAQAPAKLPDDLPTRSSVSYLEQTKLLELWLRSIPIQEVLHEASSFVEAWRRAGKDKGKLLALLRNVFNEVSLSPYTAFVDVTLSFIEALVTLGFFETTDEVDFLSFLLRQTGRHLTAYDLHVFHYRGANYPDALLLDAALKQYLRRIEKHPQLFVGASREERWRRRALRQGCLVRQLYNGLPVPDAPTSPGENARVLPPPHVRVSEEQILNPAKRTRRLFLDEPVSTLLGPAAREILTQSIADLQHAAELRELGTAVFIDRPLGRGKLPGEPDQTLLLAHEAFSTTIARKRLGVLGELVASLGGARNSTEYPVLRTEYSVPPGTFDRHPAELDRLDKIGLPVHAILPSDRPVVSLFDAARVAEDFRIVRTLPGSVAEFLSSFDFDEARRRYDLPFLDSNKLLIVPILSEVNKQPALGIFDANYQKRLELSLNLQDGFRIKGRNEYASEGLTLRGVWNEQGEIIASPNCVLQATPRSGFEPAVLGPPA